MNSFVNLNQPIRGISATIMSEAPKQETVKLHKITFPVLISNESCTRRKCRISHDMTLTFRLVKFDQLETAKQPDGLQIVSSRRFTIFSRIAQLQLQMSTATCLNTRGTEKARTVGRVDKPNAGC